MKIGQTSRTYSNYNFMLEHDFFRDNCTNTLAWNRIRFPESSISGSVTPLQGITHPHASCKKRKNDGA